MDLQTKYKEIQTHYLADNRPWVIGFSGGKDSTATARIVWEALEPLTTKEKPVYILSSNTGVENPGVLDVVSRAFAAMKIAAQDTGMPIKAVEIFPETTDSFWVNLIGRGYPPPSSRLFRWCTDRLKIKPTNKYIVSNISPEGDIVQILGIRKGESMVRDQRIEALLLEESGVAINKALPTASVYQPILNFTETDVWEYLLGSSSPWGSDHHDLAALYNVPGFENGNLSSQSDLFSGQNKSRLKGRFGCWICTLVKRDRSMESLIERGDDWMTPLLTFRDWLYQSTLKENKPAQRDHRGRRGDIKVSDKGDLLWRVFSLDYSKVILEKLLETEKRMQAAKPNICLITDDELDEIRRLWVLERQDWADSAKEIVGRQSHRGLHWAYPVSPVPASIRGSVSIIEKLSKEHNLDSRMVKKIIEVEAKHNHLRRSGKAPETDVIGDLDRVLSEDWRSISQVREDTEKEREMKTGQKSLSATVYGGVYVR